LHPLIENANPAREGHYSIIRLLGLMAIVFFFWMNYSLLKSLGPPKLAQFGWSWTRHI
jgi:hypothetical protein